MNTLAEAKNIARTVMTGYTLDRTSWHYEHGLFLQSLLALGRVTGDPGYAGFVLERMEYLISPTGSIRGYKAEDFNLDQINPGKLALELLAATGDQRYHIAARTLKAQLETQPRNRAGGYWHKKIYPHQMWLDGLYMQGPFSARYARDFKEPGIFDDLASQLILVEGKTRDVRTGLLCHAWDESRKQLWADTTTGRSPHCWGRAMGWYAMALVDTLDYLAEEHRAYDTIIMITNRLAETIRAHRSPTEGLWYQVLDQGQRPGNYLETSASAMFIYFLSKASQKGYIASTYAPIAHAAMDALIKDRLVLTGDGQTMLEGICSVAGLGGKPYRDGSFGYYIKEPVVANDFKGVGPFILACTELASEGLDS